MAIYSDGERPLVSVVIPILNEARTIDAALDSILGQSFRDIEILAVDGMSEDGTTELLTRRAESEPRLRVLTNPKRSIPAALNCGVEAARGTYLVRIDAHSTIPNDYIARVVDHLETGTWAGVGGRKNAVGGPPSGALIAAVLSSPFGVGGSTYHYAESPEETDHIPFGAYRMDVVRALGGWDERLVANEDYEFDIRVRDAGGRLFLDPSIQVDWTCRSRLIDLARQYRRYGRGKADVAFLHPKNLRARHVAPPLAVAALLAAAAATPLTPVPIVVIASGYAAGVSALSLPIARTLPGWRHRLKVPMALAAMQLPWGWGMWQGLARIARHGFTLPEPNADDDSRWGSPDWKIPEQAKD